ANGGGCYATPLVPGLLDMLTLVDPEWAAIDVGSHLPPFSDPITLHGTVALAKINEGGDLPADHESDDQNTFITLVAADQGFVAGDTCELTHQANPFSLLGIECHPLSHPVANVNASDFTFDIPLPPRPPNNPRPPRVRAFDRTPNGLPRAKVLTTFVDGPAPTVHVVVKTSAPVHGRLPSKVGKTIIAGWRPDPTPVTHLRVAVTAIEIVNALKPVTPAVALMQRCSVTTSQDCSMSACPTGESCLTLGGPI